ncbi:dTDP-4-dehydrorhamnose reductase [Luteimonas pelagia]
MSARPRRILLLGANGQVGTELRRSLAPLGEVVAATRSGLLPDGTPCEIADLEAPDRLATLVARLAPDVVANAAAYTAVDRAEDEPARAHRVNAEAPAALARACALVDAYLVHFSTDYVFDGRGTRPYRESDPTSPLGVYGASKLAGEHGIRAAGGAHAILRTAWVYAAHSHNFLRTMLRLGAEREEVAVVSDQVGCPTPAGMIADVVAGILSQPTRRTGTWHLVAEGQTSWHGFAGAIFQRAHALGLATRIPRVRAIPTTEFPTRAARPAYSVLDTTRFRHDFGIGPCHWTDGLGNVLGELARRMDAQ